MLPDRDYESLDPELLHPILAHWDPEALPERLLGSTENLVWRCRGSYPFVLRLVHSEHRSEPELQAELAWLQALAEAQLPVCHPLPTDSGALLIPCELFGERFMASAFTLLEGISQPPEGDWPIEVLLNLGKLAARLHLLGHALPGEQMLNRPDWDTHAEQASELFRGELAWLLPKFRACREALSLLPKSPEHYGLIHGDIHRGNFLIQEQHPQIYDFDDCFQGWYAQDLAWILHCALVNRNQPPEPFAAWFCEGLKRGYKTIRAWPELYSEQLEWFLQWRDFQLLLFFNRRWPDNQPLKVQTMSKKILARLRTDKTLLDPL